ncbi:MAG: histidine phosphatase family protein [bacterium]|nr:histidine phosphatase family protein [bacterium]
MKNHYFILRHGETIHQQEKKDIIYPFPEKEPIGLTEKGKKQIKKAASRLKKEKIDIIFSSDITRCRQSAEIVSQELGGIKIVFDKRLREINLGVYHGRKKEEFYIDFPRDKKRFYKVPKRGESWNEVKKRMLSFIKEIDKRHKNKNILIVSHGRPLWLLEGAVKGLRSNEEYFEQAKKIIPQTGELRKLKLK